MCGRCLMQHVSGKQLPRRYVWSTIGRIEGFGDPFESQVYKGRPPPSSSACSCSLLLGSAGLRIAGNPCGKTAAAKGVGLMQVFLLLLERCVPAQPSPAPGEPPDELAAGIFHAA